MCALAPTHLPPPPPLAPTPDPHPQTKTNPKEDASFDLARQPVDQFATYLARTFGGFFLLLGLPVSAFTFEIAKEPAQCLLSAAAGSLFITTVGARWGLAGREGVGVGGTGREYTQLNYQQEPCCVSRARPPTTPLDCTPPLQPPKVLVWRLYLGWDHVGGRLQSATVEYEETGW